MSGFIFHQTLKTWRFDQINDNS